MKKSTRWHVPPAEPDPPQSDFPGDLEPLVTAPLTCELSCGINLVQPAEITDQLRDAKEEQIRDRAYQKWEQAGSPGGDGFDFWIAAEHEILGPPASESAPPRSP